MREGLRSGKLRQRVQKDEGFSGKVLVQKKLFGMDCNVITSVDVKDVLPESTGTGSVEDTKTEKLGCSVTCSGEVEDVNECGCHEVLEFKKKRKKEDGGEWCQCPPGTGKKKVREEVSNGKVQITGRVLRLRMRPLEVEEQRAEDKAADFEMRGRDHKIEMKRVKIAEDDNNYDLIERIEERTLKRKRGRPPKACGTTPKRRGRPPLAWGPVGVSGNQLHKKQKVGSLRKSKRILETRGKLEQSRSTSKSQRETRLKNDSESNSPSLYVEVKHDNLEMCQASPLLSLEKGNMVSDDDHSATEAEESVEGGEDEGLTGASEKQLVRERIIDLLFDAGWTVEYRPRQGREYDDAVYVSPDGKTHWSVTLAYRVLKQRYEDGDADAYKEGFIFSPIPQEELNILKRVQTRRRKGKKKHEVPKWRETTERAVALKKKKKKLGCHSGMTACKMSLDGRRKRKILQYKRSDSIDAHNSPQSAGNRKRRETQNKNGCGLLVRRSDGAESDADGYVLYNGRRTTLAWMIDSGIMLDKAKVYYMNQTKSRAMLQGKITRDGIDCGCCGEAVAILHFESHAGSKLCQPLENILLENGSSLLQCQLDAWNKLKSESKWFHFVDVCGDDPNDDTCGICGDGGNLVCCDSCPSTFHQNCLDIQKFPSGDWYCLYCTCKYCGQIGEDINQENIEEMKSSLLLCRLCNQKYHKSCIPADDAMEGVHGGLHFCGRKCLEIYSKVELLLGVKHELEDGFSWTLVQRCEVGEDISSSEATRKIESNSKLAVALLVMDECFLPSSDPRSGINVIHNVLYSCESNFKRLNFSGFYTLTLEMGDEIVSVATIRIHGNILAEMPYIGTRYMYRRQGMCRRLLTAVEYVLHSLNVENLVIPAISELKNTWTSVFGFEPLEASILKKMRSMNVLVFPDVDMLQKRMLDRQFTGESNVHVEGLVTSAGEDHPRANEAVNVSDSHKIRLEKLDTDVASEVTPVNSAEETRGKPSVLKSSSQLLNGSSNDTSDITSESIDCPNCSNNINRIELGHGPCNILEGKSTTVYIPNTDCDDCKQVKEIQRHYWIAESGSLPLTSEKSHPQSERRSCGLRCLSDPMELDGDFSLRPSERFLDSHSKDSGELYVDSGSPNELNDSIVLVGSNCLEPMSRGSNETDEVPEVKTDQSSEKTLGCESCNGVCPSSTHLIEDLLPTKTCEDMHFYCNLSSGTSDTDFNLSVSDKKPVKIILDSVWRVENVTDNASVKVIQTDSFPAHDD